MDKKTILNAINPSLLEAMNKGSWNSIPYDELIRTTPQKIREEEKKLAGEEEQDIPPPGLSVRNIFIPGENDPAEIRIRVYRPTDQTNTPAMLYFHGGAFIFGAPEQMDFIFYKLAVDAGVTIFSVDYRLAPENPFPAALKDGYSVLLWLADNGESLGVDIDKIIISGSSAGGAIALSLTHMARDLGGPAIAFQYILYPATDNRLQSQSMQDLADAPMQTRESAYYMWRHYLGENHASVPEYAVPLRQDTFSNLPPAHIVVCELDPLRDEGVAYAEKLRDAGVQVELTQVMGAVHAFDFFTCELTERFLRQQTAIIRNVF